MCVAIWKTAASRLDEQDLFDAYHENIDGCGIAVRAHGRIVIQKGLWTWEEFLRRYRTVSHEDLVVHFRWATSGTISAPMCHPFDLGTPVVAVAHNGVFRGYGSGTISDTLDWCNQWLAHALRGSPWEHLQSIIATQFPGQRLIILPAQGAPLLIGEGIWHNGAWWSNRNFAGVEQTWDNDDEASEADIDIFSLRARLSNALQDMELMSRHGEPQLGIPEMREALELCDQLIAEDRYY